MQLATLFLFVLPNEAKTRSCKAYRVHSDRTQTDSVLGEHTLHFHRLICSLAEHESASRSFMRRI